MHPVVRASALALSLASQAALAQEPAQASPPPPSPSEPPQPPPAGASPYARLLLMPDLSAIASFDAAWNEDDVEAQSPRSGPFGPAGKPAFHFRELELALQSVIDPYARADVFIAFSPGEVSVEEAFLTTLSLPANLQLQAGRFFSPFGRINGQHPHSQDFVDAPLAHDRLLADEVLAGAGVQLSWLAPLPWFAELRLAAQDTAPGAADGERLTGLVRLAQFFELSDDTTLGVGLSAARRDEATGRFRDTGGADLYLRWRPAAGRSWLALQAELFGRRVHGGGAPSGTADGAPSGTDTGGYAQVLWRANPYLGAGLRYDQAPAAGEAAPGTERRSSALGAWYLTEFQRLRLQLTRDERPGGAGWEALLHLEFGIGAHGAHPF